jgi:hypothetical protein
MDHWTTDVSKVSGNVMLVYVGRIRTGYEVTRSGDVKFGDSSHGEG